MEDEYETQEWHLYKSIVFYLPDTDDFYTEFTNLKKKGKNKVKLAGFDLDSTLISSDKGAKFSTGVNDYVFAYPNIPETLKKYKDDGYCVAIISNRKVKPDGRSIKNFKQKLQNIFEQLGFECLVFALTGEGEYRKPGTKVLEVLKDLTSIDEFDEGSFFCGDAAKDYAGVKTEPNYDTPWYQWTDSDYKLTVNWNKAHPDKLNFYLPNMIFKDFPLWYTQLKSKIKLVITCGQVGSGYPNAPQDYESKNKKIMVRKLVSFRNNFQINENEIVAITGSNPTFEKREDIREKFGVTSKQTLIVWYTRASLDDLSSRQIADFTKIFESPENTGENWIRGN